MTELEVDRSAQVSAALTTVQNVRNRIPGWQRSLTAAVAEASGKEPDFGKLKLLLGDYTYTTPTESANEMTLTGIRSANEMTSTVIPSDKTPPDLLGNHQGLLFQSLLEAAKWWDSANDGVEKANSARVLSGVQAAQAALRAAMQHSLFITFANDVSRGHAGQSRSIDSYCHDWGLSAAQVNTLWSWLKEDPLKFGDTDLLIAIDTVNRCAYRKPNPGRDRWAGAAAPLLGVAATFVIVALLFLLLHAAGITTWPKTWAWKLLVLVLFVAIGAFAHIGSKALNINYDNPMKVYDAGNLIDWLSLRWVSVLRMYVPIAFVVAGLWGANNFPTTFQNLGTALLAGYTADSVFSAALSGLQSRAASSQSSTSVTPGPTGSPSAGTAPAAPTSG